MMRAYLRPFLMLLLLGLIGASGFRAEAQENPHKTPIFKPMLQAQTVNAIAWSPSGVELALFASNGVFIYDRNAQLLRHSDFAAASGGWSDDGKELIVDNHIMDSKTLTLLFDYELPFHTWLNKGSQVLTIAKDGRGIQIWDTKNGSLIKTILSPAQLEYLSPSPDGDRILAVIANSIFIFDAKKGKLVDQYRLPVTSIESYVWSANGARLAYAASTLVPAGTLGAISTADPKMSIVYHINIMDLNSGKNILTSSPIPELIFSLSWNEDGRRLAGESQFSSVYIWDANNLNQISSFSVSNQVTGRFAYSPYGGVLAIGVNSKQSSSLRINQALPTKNVFPIANNAVQIVVPEASSERLKSITQACGLQPNVQEVLIYQINANDLNTFKTHVSTLTNTDIPVGCQADLLAVADALLEK